MQKSVKEERWKYIGGSDIPIIMGLSPFKTRFELLKEKAQLEVSDFDGNEYTRYGEAMEPKIRAYVSRKKKKKYIENAGFREEIRYHADGYTEDSILEIKTTSQIHENVNDYKLYLVQLLTGMWVHSIENGVLAVYDRPMDFSQAFDEKRLTIFDIKFADYTDLWEQICKARASFLADLEYLRENPFALEDDLPSGSALTTRVNEILALQEQIVAMKKVEKLIDEKKEELKEAMQKNGIKSWDFGAGKITLVADGEDKTVSKFDEAAFQAEHARLYKKYLVEKIQKGRKGYVKITVR